MRILKAMNTHYFPDEDLENLESKLSDKFGEKVVIIPAGIEVVTGFTDTFLENRKGITYHDNSDLENMRENK